MSGPSDEVIGKVRSWLETEGYPLELRTAREFRRLGADVHVGRFYVDPDSKEPREIDVIAVFTAVGAQTQKAAAVSFVIECKSQPKDSRPWVMFTLPSMASEVPLTWRPHEARFGSKINAVSKHWSPNRACIDLVGKHAHAAVEARMGDSKKADPVFPALTAVTKASFWWATAHHGIPDERPHVVFPVVVADAPLISCAMPDAGDDLEVTPIESGAIPLRSARPVGNRGVTAIDIVTSASLAKYASDSATMANDLALLLIADPN